MTTSPGFCPTTWLKPELRSIAGEAPGVPVSSMTRPLPWRRSAMKRPAARPPATLSAPTWASTGVPGAARRSTVTTGTPAAWAAPKQPARPSTVRGLITRPLIPRARAFSHPASWVASRSWPSSGRMVTSPRSAAAAAAPSSMTAKKGKPRPGTEYAMVMACWAPADGTGASSAAASSVAANTRGKDDGFTISSLLTGVSRPAPPTKLVEQDRADDDRALDDGLVVGRDVHEHEPVRQHADQQRAGQGTQNRAPPT